MKYKKGELVEMPPDEAANHGSKVILRDMKKSLYLVAENFESKPKKVKRAARKDTDKG